MSYVIGTSPISQLSTPTAGFSVVQTRRQGKSAASTGKLNLVSLMDIFTILVFFLMLNSGDVEVLQPDEKILLPKSTATLKPDDVPVIKITGDAILFRDNPVVNVSELSSGKSIVALEEALARYTAENSERFEAAEAQGVSAKGITIMSDASVSYSLLKRVLYSSAQSGYRDVGLATEFGQVGAAVAESASLPKGRG